MIELIKSDERERRKAKLDKIKSRNVALNAKLMRDVTTIIDDVRARGDAALVDYTRKFDGVKLDTSELRVDLDTLHQHARRVDIKVLQALREAIKRIRAFHEEEHARFVASWQIEAANGVRIGQRVLPIEKAGLYVPGGTASYPSSVVMNVVPAQVAGVKRLAVVTPPRTFAENPAVAAALVELHITEIYQVGGAHSIAALAYGTETVQRVDKITGPGNKYVAAAKKLVFGAVGIDSIAGPSEVIVLADETARADYVAADLLAQAEHGEDASAVLVTTSEKLAREVFAELQRQTKTLSRHAIVKESLAQFGALFIVETTDEACALVNELAPEHLEIITRDDEDTAARIVHAGAIFFGAHTPEACGDYFAGPNHVLPTGGAARFSSALSVTDFIRRSTLLHYSQTEMTDTASMIAALAHAEGLDAHARSALIRVPSSKFQVPSSNTLSSNPQSAIRNPQSKNLELGTWNLELKVKSRVRALHPYTLTPEVGRIKINQNENPHDASARIKAETLRRMNKRAWSRYPDFVPVSLHEKLASFTNWRADGIVAGNGSNELIQSLLMVTITTGKRVLICEPTFALYAQVTTILGGEIISVPLTSELTFDVEAIINKVRETRADVTIICSPNNPTGCVLSVEDLKELLETTRGLVAVDEAYQDFARHTVAPLLETYKNLAVFRTFSKALALAALRVGYLLAAPELAREISKAVLPYNLNAFSQTAAEVALELYDTELRPTVELIISERDRLFVELQKIKGLAPVSSHANFFVVKTTIEPKRVFKELLARGILIRDVSSYPMLKDYFRVSVGTPIENDALLDALREIFA